MKNKKAIIIGIVLGILVLLTSGTMVVKSGVFDPYEKQIKLGYKMLEEKKYDEAILAFDEAIKIDDKRTKAYIGQGDTYIARFDKDVVNEINTALTNGYKKNPDEIYVETYIKYADVFIDKDKSEQGLDLLKYGYGLTKNLMLKSEVYRIIKIIYKDLLDNIYELSENNNIEAARKIIHTYRFRSLFHKIEENDRMIYIPDNKKNKGIGIYNIRGSIYIYYGDYKENIRSGKGIWFKNCQDAYMFEGNWSNDKPNGYGINYSDNQEERGNLIDGLWNGETKVVRSGTEYSVNYDNGIPDVIKKLYNADIVSVNTLGASREEGMGSSDGDMEKLTRGVWGFADKWDDYNFWYIK